MVDDDRIEQLAKQKNFLNDELIEQVRQEIRNAADRGEQLSFIDAALRTHLLNDFQANHLKQQADREVSGLETEDISAALPPGITADRAEPGQEPGQALPEGEPAAEGAGDKDASTEPPGEVSPSKAATEGEAAAEGASTDDTATSAETPAEIESAPQEQTPAEPAQPQASLRTAVFIGFAVLVVIAIIVAILNR